MKKIFILFIIIFSINNLKALTKTYEYTTAGTYSNILSDIPDNAINIKISQIVLIGGGGGGSGGVIIMLGWKRRNW
jgi:hypothetical protein